jgi:hypothetical protein
MNNNTMISQKQQQCMSLSFLTFLVCMPGTQSQFAPFFAPYPTPQPPQFNFDPAFIQQPTQFNPAYMQPLHNDLFSFAAPISPPPLTISPQPPSSIINLSHNLLDLQHPFEEIHFPVKIDNLHSQVDVSVPVKSKVGRKPRIRPTDPELIRQELKAKRAKNTLAGM